jgi:hypothetical protein
MPITNCLSLISSSEFLHKLSVFCGYSIRMAFLRDVSIVSVIALLFVDTHTTAQMNFVDNYGKLNKDRFTHVRCMINV